MFQRFEQYIQYHFPHLLPAKIIVATSGGLDSVVLIHLLFKLKYKIALAHVNYQLRENESDRDESFVKELAEKLDIQFYTHSIDTHTYAKKKGISIQMAAREIRYNWFEYLLKNKNYDYVVTAHHLNDAIETFFINLNRSSGLEGLKGIPAENGKIIRPLLTFSRTEIENFAIENKIQWREDASNATTKYERNKIRHLLLPVLQEINLDFNDAFAKTQSYLSGSQALVDDYLKLLKEKSWKNTNDVITVNLNELIDLPNLKPILYEMFKQYGFTAWDDVYNLVYAQTGKQVFSDSHFLLKDRDFLQLGKIEKEINKFEIVKIPIAGSFVIENISFNVETIPATDSINIKSNASTEIYIDTDKVNFPLFVRKWQKGDYFYPLGMIGKKKLSDFLIDSKISRFEKEKIWLLCDAQNQVVWVIGKRLDNRFRITDNTIEILKITTQYEKNS